MVGVSRAPWNGVYPFVLGVNINGGLSSRLMCVWTWCIGCLCGEKSRVLPACFITLRLSYINLLFVLGDDGTYMYGIIQWSPGPIQGVLVLPVV